MNEIANNNIIINKDETETKIYTWEKDGKKIINTSKKYL